MDVIRSLFSQVFVYMSSESTFFLAPISARYSVKHFMLTYFFLNVLDMVYLVRVILWQNLL